MSLPISPGDPYGAVPGGGYEAPRSAPAQPVPGYPLRPRPSATAADEAGADALYVAPEQPVCQVCCGSPATEVAVRHHQGLLLFLLFRKQKGRFCRTCGTALFRGLTAKTLWQGWWHPLSALIFNPLTIVVNLRARAKINHLHEPGYDLLGTRRDPGKPVFRRPAALVAVVPAAFVLYVLGALVVG